MRKSKKRPIKRLGQQIVIVNHHKKEPEYDWLKYWRVVRYWVREAYGLSLEDFELLLFLYSEGLFSKDDFERYERIMTWSSTRFARLKKEEWIVVWRARTKDECALYELSFKAKRLVNSVYKKLAMEEVISEKPADNPIFKANTTFMQRKYRRMIVQLNKLIKERLNNKKKL